MTILSRPLTLPDADKQANHAQMMAAIGRIDTKAGQILKGGSERARQRHIDRGKLLPRTRIDRLLDPGSFFWRSDCLRQADYMMTRCPHPA